MLTTHVGSLPFLDVERALDYTFLFDIPVIFTLPQLDSQQFINKEIFEVNKMGTPFYYQDFLKRAKKNNIKKIKYQLVGPISFFEMHPDTALSFEELLKIHNHIVTVLLSDFDLIFVVDEPCLKGFEHSKYDQLERFHKNLVKHDRLEVFIHCCNKMDLRYTQKLREVNFHLDISLYSFEELEQSYNAKSFIGIPCIDSRIKNDFLGNEKIMSQLNYISPSCGLALNTIDELGIIFENLTKYKVGR